jgi:hypothetical protein
VAEGGVGCDVGEYVVERDSKRDEYRAQKDVV